MTFRLVRGSLAVAAVTVSVLIVPSFAATPPHAGCLTVTDPKGDTSPAADPALDLTGFSLTNVGTRLVVTVTVAQASVRPLYAPDSRIDVNFTVGSKRVTMFAKNSLQRAQEGNVFSQQGIRIKDASAAGEGALVSGAAVEATVSGNTLTMRVKQTDLRNAVAEKTEGVRFTGIQALARANYLYYDANTTFDTADAPAKAVIIGGAAC